MARRLESIAVRKRLGLRWLRPGGFREGLGLVVVGLLLGLALVGARRAVADVVHLRSGGTLEGTVRHGADGTMTVRQGDGSVITLSAADVARVEKRESPKEELARRLEDVPGDELEPLIELLVWAREKRLHKGVKRIASRILQIDPHHELARSALGYVVFENRWIRKSELRARGGLVRFRGEWIPKPEKEERLREELRKELQVDLKMLGSDNPHIRRLSERKLRRVLSGKDPLIRDVLGEHVLHPQKEFRMLALAVLAQFPAREGEPPERVRRIASRLHELALRESEGEIGSLVDTALAKFAPRVSFRLALDATHRVEDGKARDTRLGDILHATLRTDLVPALIEALRTSDGRTHEVVLGVLVRVFQVDFGYDMAAWERYWEGHRKRYRDAD